MRADDYRVSADSIMPWYSTHLPLLATFLNSGLRDECSGASCMKNKLLTFTARTIIQPEPSRKLLSHLESEYAVENLTCPGTRFDVEQLFPFDIVA